MKIHCRALLVAFFSILPLAAQEGDGFGFLNIVNLIPGKSFVDVTIAGKILDPDGLEPGSPTGWFMVPVGRKPITISLPQTDGRKSEIAKVSGKIELAKGRANVIAIFLQPDPRKKADGSSFPAKISIHSFPAFDGKGFALRFVSTCPTDNRFKIGPKWIETKPCEIVEVPSWSGAAFDIMRNGKIIGRAMDSSEQGSFYVFVGTNEAGEFITATTRAGTQSAPPWMKKNKKPHQP